MHCRNNRRNNLDLSNPQALQQIQPATDPLQVQNKASSAQAVDKAKKKKEKNAVWTTEEETFMGQLKLREVQRDGDARKNNQKPPGKMTKSKVICCLMDSLYLP